MGTRNSEHESGLKSVPAITGNRKVQRTYISKGETDSQILIPGDAQRPKKKSAMSEKEGGRIAE
jgi:hypothetical protein